MGRHRYGRGEFVLASNDYDNCYQLRKEYTVPLLMSRGDRQHRQSQVFRLTQESEGAL
jgi:hypothetical protein